MKLQGEITSDCLCYKYDENGEPVLDENGYPEHLGFCYGDCYTEQVADFTDNVLPEFMKFHRLSSPDFTITIKGSGMTWRGVSGERNARLSEIVSTLEIDGDFTLRFTYDTENGELVFVRSSHDELGARFEIVEHKSDPMMWR